MNAEVDVFPALAGNTLNPINILLVKSLVMEANSLLILKDTNCLFICAYLKIRVRADWRREFRFP
jgi:polyferredoxin